MARLGGMVKVHSRVRRNIIYVSVKHNDPAALILGHAASLLIVVDDIIYYVKYYIFVIKEAEMHLFILLRRLA